jgi:methylated-DNA-[protein]-cysteine S-methyltransferase
MQTTAAHYTSALGVLEVVGAETGICAVRFIEEVPAASPETEPWPVVQAAIRELDEYFRSARQTFTVPLRPQGTAFQQQVWQQLRQIPFGVTVSYAEVANVLGKPTAIRAVGLANGKNPICILIPCHRVIGSNGKLTGYGGGLWRKEWLLRHEKCALL